MVDNLFTQKGSTEGREAIASQLLDLLNKLAGGDVFFPLFHDVKDQFNPGGDAQFVIDAEQIVAHRVLRDAKSYRNLLVRQAFRHEIRDVGFAGGQQFHSRRRSLPDGLCLR